MQAEVDEDFQTYVRLIKQIKVEDKLENLQTLLINGTWPCFESRIKGDMTPNGTLKSCQWKGRNIPCSAIFTVVPTDMGMCCSFNSMQAENMFQNQRYAEFIKNHQGAFSENSVYSDFPGNIKIIISAQCYKTFYNIYLQNFKVS